MRPSHVHAAERPARVRSPTPPPTQPPPCTYVHETRRSRARSPSPREERQARREPELQSDRAEGGEFFRERMSRDCKFDDFPNAAKFRVWEMSFMMLFRTRFTVSSSVKSQSWKRSSAWNPKCYQADSL